MKSHCGLDAAAAGRPAIIYAVLVFVLSKVEKFSVETRAERQRVWNGYGYFTSNLCVIVKRKCAYIVVHFRILYVIAVYRYTVYNNNNNKSRTIEIGFSSIFFECLYTAHHYFGIKNNARAVKIKIYIILTAYYFFLLRLIE